MLSQEDLTPPAQALPSSLEEPLSPSSSPLPPSSITAQELLANPDATGSKWKRVLMIVISICFDAFVPLAFYFIIRTFMDPMWALFVSGVPALLIFIVRMIWKREVSAVALMTFFGFILSSVASFATNDPRILLLEKSLTMGIIGLLHVITIIPFPTLDAKIHRRPPFSVVVTKGKPIKPFVFYIAKQFYPLGNMNPAFTDGLEVSKYDWIWQNIKKFRTHMRIVTGILGLSLLFEFFIKVILIFSSLDVDEVMLYSNILFAVIMALSFLFLAVYIYFAKTSFYKHVDAWIAKHYAATQSLKLKVVVVNTEASPLL